LSSKQLHQDSVPDRYKEVWGSNHRLIPTKNPKTFAGKNLGKCIYALTPLLSNLGPNMLHFLLNQKVMKNKRYICI
jgi:hypothetical protein